MTNLPLMKCGCAGMGTHKNPHDGLPENHPCCIVCDCCEIVETPDLSGRIARCAYFGKPVKGGWVNSNCCSKCECGENCKCERPSSTNLWFFVHKPKEEYDEFYCACHGAD